MEKSIKSTVKRVDGYLDGGGKLHKSITSAMIQNFAHDIVVLIDGRTSNVLESTIVSVLDALFSTIEAKQFTQNNFPLIIEAFNQLEVEERQRLEAGTTILKDLMNREKAG